MTKEEKKVAIEDLKDALGKMKNLYLADIAGLDAIVKYVCLSLGTLDVNLIWKLDLFV